MSTHAAMDKLGDDIAELAAHLDAATWRLLTHIREFDAGGGWQQQGAASCAAWLSWRVGWSTRTAREHVRVARALPSVPTIDDQLRTGQLSYSKVRAMTKVATPDNEALLVHYATYSTGAQLETICGQYQAVQARERHSADDIARRRTVLMNHTPDGLMKIEAVLRPDEAALVWAAIGQVLKSLQPAEAGGSAEPRPRCNRADALVAIAEASVRGARVDRSAVEVVVTVSRDGLRRDSTEHSELARFADGTVVGLDTARRLACDAGRVELEEDAAGHPLSVGRKTRTIPAAIKRALLHRDHHCRFPGCRNRAFVEGHHLEHWVDGGETRLENLLTLCSRHHPLVHEHGFTVKLVTVDGSAEPRFYDGHGREVPAVPPRPWVATPSLPVDAGVHIDGATNRSRWDGRPVDYQACVGGLLHASCEHEAEST